MTEEQNEQVEFMLADIEQLELDLELAKMEEEQIVKSIRYKEKELKKVKDRLESYKLNPDF